MWTPDSLRWLKHSAAASYGVAVPSVIAALFIARWLDIQYGFAPLAPVSFRRPVQRHPPDAQMSLSRLLIAAPIGLFIEVQALPERGTRLTVHVPY
jgi:hypothetical protein